MTREKRIVLFNILKQSLPDSHKESIDKLEDIVYDDAAMDIMFSFVTMYAAEEPRFIEVLEYTVGVLKDGASDNPTH